MSKYKCVIFDCDGVLVDSEPIGNQVLVDMANQLGANIDLEYAYKHFKGGKMQSCVDKISTLINHPIPENFSIRYRQKSFEAFKNNIKPVEGVTDFVQSLEFLDSLSLQARSFVKRTEAKQCGRAIGCNLNGDVQHLTRRTHLSGPGEVSGEVEQHAFAELVRSVPAVPAGRYPGHHGDHLPRVPGKLHFTARQIPAEHVAV